MRIKFSPSAFNTYLQCSQKYYFSYEDDYVKQHREEFRRPSPHAYMGNIVHVVISKFFSLPSEQQTLDNLKRLLYKQWPKPVGATGGFTNIDEERDFIQQALDLLSTFFTLQADASHLAYVGNQESFEEMLQAHFAKDIILHGRVDRIDREADGLHVIDYKTGKEQSSELQLMIYALLAEAALREPVRRVSYFYLKTGELHTFEADETMQRETAGRITHTVAAIRQERFVPKPTRLCQYCEFLKLCPAKAQVDELISSGGMPAHEDFFEVA